MLSYFLNHVIGTEKQHEEEKGPQIIPIFLISRETSIAVVRVTLSVGRLFVYICAPAFELVPSSRTMGQSSTFGRLSSVRTGRDSVDIINADDVLSRAAARYAFQQALAPPSTTASFSSRPSSPPLPLPPPPPPQAHVRRSATFRQAQVRAQLARSSSLDGVFRRNLKPPSMTVPTLRNESSNYATWDLAMPPQTFSRRRSASLRNVSHQIPAPAVPVTVSEHGIRGSLNLNKKDLNSTPRHLSQSSTSFLRGGDDFIEISLRRQNEMTSNNHKISNDAFKQIPAALPKAKNSLLNAIKNFFSFKQYNHSANMILKQSNAPFTGFETGPRRRTGAKLQIPPQHVESRLSHYRALSTGKNNGNPTASRRRSSDLWMPDRNLQQRAMPSRGSVSEAADNSTILQDKTNRTVLFDGTWVRPSRNSSYGSAHQFALEPARLAEHSVFSRPLPNNVSPQRVYSALIRRLNNSDETVKSSVSSAAVVAAVAATSRSHSLSRQPSLSDGAIRKAQSDISYSIPDSVQVQIKSRNVSHSSMGKSVSLLEPVPEEVLSADVPPGKSSIRIVQPTQEEYEAQLSKPRTNITTADRLYMFFSDPSSGSNLSPPKTRTSNKPSAEVVLPQNTGATAVSWAASKPSNMAARVPSRREISSFFPNYDVITTAPARSTSITSKSQWRQWQDGNVFDNLSSPKSDEASEFAVTGRHHIGGVLSPIQNEQADTKKENEQVLDIFSQSINESISKAVDLQFGSLW
ncbi:hypothetical protein V1514DRAFT_327995 [Lipomyces japonicus]|uniref:uncharacterized protein n=1 Tax=Lipomyces japonicus TaxID=56871 RepID=UPI0034CEE12C